MEISVPELVELQNAIGELSHNAFKEGVKKESEKPLPNNLFDALLQYAKKSKTLIDYAKSKGCNDGCNWIQIKPTRVGSDKVAHVEISFDSNLMEIFHVGTQLKK